MSIGDIASDARGSGARFNTGKPPTELVPLRDAAALFGPPLAPVVTCLAQFQEGGGLPDLRAAYRALGPLREVWSEEAAVFGYGAAKYAAWNWAKGMAWTVPLACAVRHLLALDSGETNDPESGLPHRGHIACNLRMLIFYQSSFPEGDDRPAILRR